MSTLVEDLRAELRIARATRQELLARLAAAEQERDQAEARARIHAASSNDLGEQLGAANLRTIAAEAERDAAVTQAEELTRALRAAQSDLARALADGRVELRQRADDAERVAADLRDDLDRLRAAVAERFNSFAAWRAGTQEALGDAVTGSASGPDEQRLRALGARVDAADAALRALVPTEVSRG